MGKISQDLNSANIVSCAFTKIYRELDAEDQDALSHAITSGVSGYVLHNVLRNNGHKIAASTISLHIRGICPCADIKVK